MLFRSVKDYSEKWSRNKKFKITKDNKPKINLKHLVHYILLYIACVDNLYNIYLHQRKNNKDI